jgi:hypothetical protein
VVEVEVTQQKSNLDSLPLGECQVATKTITTKIKEIIEAWVKKKTILYLSIDAIYKALIFCTQLTVAQLATAPMIKKYGDDGPSISLGYEDRCI